MRTILVVVWMLLVLGSCKTTEEHEIAELEKSLGLDVAPHFPKCLREELSPRAASLAGDYSIANTLDNPQGNVSIDRCVRWDIDEPAGSEEKKP